MTEATYQAISYKHTYGEAGDLRHARRRQPDVAERPRGRRRACAASASCSISSSPRRASRAASGRRARWSAPSTSIPSDPLLERRGRSGARRCSTRRLRRPLMVKETVAEYTVRRREKKRAVAEPAGRGHRHARARVPRGRRRASSARAPPRSSIAASGATRSSTCRPS